MLDGLLRRLRAGGIQAIGVEHAVQVVELVLQDAREPAGGAQLVAIAVLVLRHEDRVLAPRKLEALARDREAPLFVVLAGLVDRHRSDPEFGVGCDATRTRAVSFGPVVDEQPLADAHLRCSQADAGRGLHGGEHVGDQRGQLGVEVDDRLRDLMQDGLSGDADGQNGHVLQNIREVAQYGRRVLFTALDDLAAEISLTPLQALGIPVAIVGAIFLSVGTQFQHRGVGHFEGGDQRGAQLGRSALLRLLKNPAWVVGTLLLGLAIVMQIGALALAPLIVVQPLGAVALVVTAILNSRLAGIKLDHRTIRAIVTCLLGIGIFVGVAAIFAIERPIQDRQLLTVLALLLVALVGLALAWRAYRDRANAIFYIVTAGVLYGFVVTLSKIVINRIISGNFDWLTIVCGVALTIAMLAGSYAVQLAHASGPPDLVIAGLTVVDPLVAVLIGVTILGEAAATPPWAIIVFAAAGGLAIWGVLQLARHHPQIRMPAASEENND